MNGMYLVVFLRFAIHQFVASPLQFCIHAQTPFLDWLEPLFIILFEYVCSLFLKKASFVGDAVMCLINTRLVEVTDV